MIRTRRAARQYREGFTLVEALIALALTMIVYVALLGFHTQGWQGFKSGLGYLAVYRDGRTVMQRLTTDIRLAERVLVSYTIDGHEYVSGAHELVLRLPSVGADKGRAPAAAPAFDVVAYHLNHDDPKVLECAIAPGTAESVRSFWNELWGAAVARTVASFDVAYFVSGSDDPLPPGQDVSPAEAVGVSVTVSKVAAERKLYEYRSYQETLGARVRLQNKR